MATKPLRINSQIRVREVRLLDENGEQQGIVSTAEALEMAKNADLDLVEIAPQANPPVCRILDYGKFKFEQEKKNKESRKRQKLVKLKEIRMQPKIEKHDMEFKTKHVREFLEDGFKVKVTVRFRGRELAHTELGRKVLDAILGMLEGAANVDRPPQMEGRFMSMILSPKASKNTQKRGEKSNAENANP